MIFLATIFSIVFFYQPLFLRALVFSRTPVCNSNTNSDVHCQELLTGTLTLRNEESLTVAATLSEAIGGSENNHIFVTVEKSPVMFAYDMQYEMDVFSSFREDVYEFSYKDVGKDPARFCYVDDVERCHRTGPIPRAPNNIPLPWSSGKCCWCGDATFISSRDDPGRRSALRCGGFDAFMGRSVWTIKTCPRVSGPWYSALSFGPWRWDYTIRVALEWFAPRRYDDPQSDGLFSSEARLAEFECLKSLAFQQPSPILNLEGKNSKKQHRQPNFSPETEEKNWRLALRKCAEQRAKRAGLHSVEHFLNVSTPGIYNDKFHIGLRITGSQPETDALPPPMNDKVLFIPTWPSDDPVVQKSKLSNGCGIHGIENLQKFSSASSDKLLKKGLDTIYQQLDPPKKQPSISSRLLLEKELASSQRDAFNNASKTTSNSLTLKHQKALKTIPTCLSHAMLLPKTMTDFTGVRCDVIGTSLRKWGDLDGQFCTSRAGSCMSNQIGPLRKQDENRVRQGLAPKYMLNDLSIPGGFSGDPRIFAPNTFDFQNRQHKFYVAWVYRKEHVTSLDIQLDSEQIAWLQTSIQGEIGDIRVPEHCQPLDGVGCVVEAECINKSASVGRFIISVPYCVNSMTLEVTSDIKPVGSVGMIVQAHSRNVTSLSIESRSDSLSFFTCKIVLQDEHYRPLDHALFNISFGDINRRYQGLQAQAWTPNINVTFADSQGRVLSFAQLLQSFSSPLKTASSSFYNNQCNCGLLNFFCIFANFFGCLAKARTMIVSSIGVVGLAAVTYICGPSATFCLKCFGKKIVAMRERHRAYLVTTEESPSSTFRKKRYDEHDDDDNNNINSSIKYTNDNEISSAKRNNNSNEVYSSTAAEDPKGVEGEAIFNNGEDEEEDRK